MRKTLRNRFLMAALALAACGAMNAAEPIFYEDFPYTLTDLPEGWVALDANNDGKTWKPSYGDVEITDFFTPVDLDDWLFSPAINLVAGKTYMIEFTKAHGYQGDNPSLCVKYGTSQTPEGMTKEIMPSTEVELYFANGSDKFLVTPDKTGPIHIGFHATGTGTSGIKVDEVKVKEATFPAAVEDLKVVKTGEYGSPNVKVSFKAPSKTAAGDALASISKIVVTRSGIQIKELTDVTPGQFVEFDDVCSYGSGNYVWKVVAYDGDDAGLEAEFGPVYVGLNMPKPAGNVVVTEEGHTGKMTVTWDKVTEDVAGETVPEGILDYQIYYNGDCLVSTGAVSPYEFEACSPDEQVFGSVLVIAKNSYSSSTAASNQFVAGKMLTSFRESFDDGQANNNLRQSGNSDDNTKTASLMVFDDAMLYMYYGIPEGDADGTNGCAAFFGQSSGCLGSIELGKFDLSGLDNPALSFQVMFTATEEETKDRNTYTVTADRGKGSELLMKYDMANEPVGRGWRKVIVPLKDVKADEFIPKITGEVVNNSVVAIDDIRIFNFKDNNLGVATLTLPESAVPGEEFPVGVKVENIGVNKSEAGNVTLYKEGVKVGSAELAALESGEAAVVSFKHALTLLDPDSVKFTAVIELEDDDMSDNTSDEFVVANNLPRYPYVSDLSAKSEEIGKATLGWTAPSMEFEPEATMESFEDEFGGQINKYGDWSFIDGDDGVTGVIDYYALPGEGEKMAALTVDCTGLYSPFIPYEGSKMMVMHVALEVDTDDWLISPELSGAAQTVKFYARSYDSYGYLPEYFDFAVSKDGKTAEDFTAVAENVRAGGLWTEFSYELEEGVKYFAIHYKPLNAEGLMLFLDNFTFVTAEAARPLELIGYNVYRDGEKVNDEPLEETAYEETGVESGEHTYHVTTIVDRGESRASNPAAVDVLSGVKGVSATGVAVSATENGVQISSDAEREFTVVSADGKVLTRTKVEGTANVELAAGVYIVTTEGFTCKVIVR